MKNLEIVKNAISAISQSDAEGLLSLFAEDMTFEMNGHTPFSRKLKGKEAFVALFAEVMEHLAAGIPLTINNLIDAGEWIICETTGHATMKTGEPYENNYCMLWRLRDGKIIQLKEYNDSQLIMERFNFN
ncbi:MAG: nuclear transport factor 2 family protein [Pseudomonadales bacterium]|nr:nuclear transport factor 2 family protein [Pseudomonadales bacterium]